MPEDQTIPPSDEPIPVARVWQPPPPPPPQGPTGYASSAYGGYPPYGGGYAIALRSRPGAITMLGTLSIIVASATLIGSLVSAFEGLRELGTVNIARFAAVAAARQQAAQPGRTPRGLPVGPQGLAMSERDVAISVFASRLPLSNARLAQLDSLLADSGQTILGVDQGLVTSSITRAAIRESGAGRSFRANQEGPSLFTLASGSMELYDDHAIFRPDDHSGDIRAAADVNAYLRAHDDPAAVSMNTTATPAPALPPAVVAAGRTAGQAAMVVLSEAGVSALLAIYLLVVGIVTLRSSRLGGLLHWIYVPIKTLLIVWAVFAWARLSNGISAIAATIPAGSPIRLTNPMQGLPQIMSVLASAYVVFLVVMLLMPSTREFYRKEA